MLSRTQRPNSCLRFDALTAVIKQTNIKKSALVAVSVLLLLQGCTQNSQPQPPSSDVSASETQPASAAKSLTVLNARVSPMPFQRVECSGKDCPEIDIYQIESNYQKIDALVKRQIVSYVAELMQGFNVNPASDVHSSAEQSKSPVTSMNAQLKQKASSAAQNSADDAQTLQQSIHLFYELAEENKSLGGSNKLNIYIKPQVINPQGPIATVVINASNYLGGAHGSSAQQYLNFNLENEQMLNLDSIIKSGKRKAFNDIAFKAYQDWVTQTQTDITFEDYQKMWKFSVSENFFLSPQGLILQYGEYEIGPYAVGLPRLIIPYQDLRDVLEDQYLPPQQLAASDTVSSAVATASSVKQ
ncbi:MULTISPECIES: RsiV family protein [unclassified Acinetobacter]|uniref:RsiV family protein n=1 Tax=unclassified Acinetobacter TaxID=196816 RepID=UPI0035BABDCD